MLKKRVYITAVTLLIASGVFTFGQWRWLVGAYPSVAATETDELGYWLALVDLETQPESLRRDLVDRFQSELNQGWSPLTTHQEDENVNLGAYQNIVAHNVEMLTREWFYYRCEQYTQVAADQNRLGFIGPQVDTVLLWADVYSQVSYPGQAASEENAFDLFDKLDSWILEAESDRHAGLNLGIHHSVLYWLGINRVDSLSLGTRRKLAERIAAALGGGASESARSLELTGVQLEQLQENAFTLIEAWLLNRSLEFADLSAGQREAYLDRQLETVTQWQLEKLLTGGASDLGATNHGQLLKLMSQLAIWADRAPQQHREAYRLLTRELQQYALKKLLSLQ